MVLNYDREAAYRFPDIAAFQQDFTCCAGHEGFIDEGFEQPI